METLEGPESPRSHPVCATEREQLHLPGASRSPEVREGQAKSRTQDTATGGGGGRGSWAEWQRATPLECGHHGSVAEAVWQRLSGAEAWGSSQRACPGMGRGPH